MHGVIRRSTLAVAVLSLALVAALQAAAGPPGGDYTVTDLVSNLPGAVQPPDPDLVNGWGLARSATSPWWVADNGPDPSTSKSTLYNSAGVKQALTVSVPGGPTGTVFTGIAGSFQIGTTATTTLAGSNFVFATEAGTILAWRGGSTAALPAPVTGVAPGAVFKGLTLATPTPGNPLLYATDFHNAQIDVFNGAWQNVTPAGSFADPGIPSGFAPFGIQAIGSSIFVTYGKQDAVAHDEVDAQSLGFVDQYDLQGNLVARVAQRGQLNGPWGLAMAPAGFGRYGGDLLVGNFGDGQINAFTQNGGGWHHDGTLRSSDGGKLVIDGLWALQFGNAGANGDPNTLFFAAGPDDESNGLFGTITSG
jgi:uncharacterized protein (TIGR03118 family)